MDTSAGPLTLALDPLRAPIATGNFLNHAARGDYDNTIFHRVVPAFVIQGGGWTFDPQTRVLSDRSKLAKDSGHADDTIVNEWTNGLKNTRGTIAMAREEQPDTATREFYINVADNAKLDTPRDTTGKAGYAVFGRIVEGMDTVEKIRTGRTEPRPDVTSEEGGLKDVPVDPVRILRVVRMDRGK
jgi:cyclophilin family peptidyl-prolyl cis-trans isomerase